MQQKIALQKKQILRKIGVCEDCGDLFETEYLPETKCFSCWDKDKVKSW